MTIEAALERIASALEAISRQNTPALVARAILDAPLTGTDATPQKRGPGRPPKEEGPKTAEPENDFLEDEAPPAELAIEDVRRALVEYQKRAVSADKARAVLKEHGGVDTLKALKPEKYRAVYDAAMKA